MASGVDGGPIKNPLLNLDSSKKDDRDELFRYILTPLRVLMDVRKLSIKVNPYLLLDAIVHAQRDLRLFTGPDAFKMGGHVGFWISRLKPFRMMDKPLNVHTNETVALHLALSVVSESMGQKKIHHKILANLLYDLRYGTVTPMAFSNELQLLYCQEYADKNP